MQEKALAASGTRNYAGLGHDVILVTATAVLAGCGLVYEYLIAHVAGRMLGAIEAVIFSMIGIMIVSMGIGPFLVRTIRDPFTAFVWLEGALATVGAISVLTMGAAASAAVLLPQTIAETYGLPSDLIPKGGLAIHAESIANAVPYVIGVIIGMLIGMEIPLIARMRETLHDRHLVHNVGTIYGTDYIGAGIGAAIWVMWMLAMEPAVAAVMTAGANVAIGTAFVLRYRKRIRKANLLIGAHVALGVVLISVSGKVADWSGTLEDLLYTDRVVLSHQSDHQRLVVTERIRGQGARPVYKFHINGRLQFDSRDEHIYHAMLTYPALAASARQDKVLIIGGGDGLALRDILRWEPDEVTLVDLDRELVDLFSNPEAPGIRGVLARLNQGALTDTRVEVRHGDAFLVVDQLINAGKRYDTIVVDLPDPSHVDLNRLYTVRFYAKLLAVLAGDGTMSVQSTSPYHARNAFIAIGKTISVAGFAHTEQYRQNVPSFGEWGWTIAVANGRSASRRLREDASFGVDDGWTTREIVLGAFAFPKHFFEGRDKIRISRLGNAAAYQYHQQAWETRQGLVEDGADSKQY